MIVSSAFADETETFSAQKPDVLIVLDGSGSMLYTPSNSDCKNEGGTGYSCGNKVYGNANCDNSTLVLIVQQIRTEHRLQEDCNCSKSVN